MSDLFDVGYRDFQFALEYETIFGVLYGVFLTRKRDEASARVAAVQFADTFTRGADMKLRSCRLASNSHGAPNG